MRHRIIAALFACGLLAMAVPASARHHNRNRDAQSEPGDFAYYVLSLSWSPAFCLSQPSSAECEGPRSYGFIVHGLWPQNEQGWPEQCDVHVKVPDELVNSLADIMPARKLIYHEWSTHGTCSGLQPEAYFALLRKAREGITVPADFSDPHQQIERAPGTVLAEFMQANPKLPASSVAVLCSGQSTPRLREVHICLAKDLKARECSAQVLKQACRAPSLIVPPVR